LSGNTDLLSFSFGLNGQDLGIDETARIDEFDLGTDASGRITFWNINITSFSSVTVDGREYQRARFAAESFEGSDKGDALFLGGCISNCSGIGGEINGNTGFIADVTRPENWGSATVVPLPAAAWMLFAGIGCLVAVGRRKAL
jgi:hypothetical protein